MFEDETAGEFGLVSTCSVRQLNQLLPVLTAALCVFAAVCCAQPVPNLQIQVSKETVPAGGTAQFKITVAAPAEIATGRIVMDFDPTLFGDVISAAVFSANGDAYGYVNVTNGHHLDARFTSPLGSIGACRIFRSWRSQLRFCHRCLWARRWQLCSKRIRERGRVLWAVRIPSRYFRGF